MADLSDTMKEHCLYPNHSSPSFYPDIKPGDHICYFYHDPQQQLHTVANYLADGLRSGNHCLYIAVDQTPQTIKDALVQCGICADEACEKKDLIFLTKEETYLKNGKFSPKKMLEEVHLMAKLAEAPDSPILRVAGEMSWVLENPLYLTEMVEYELAADCFFLKHKPRVIGLCQYNTLLFPSSALIGARLSHRIIYQDR